MKPEYVPRNTSLCHKRRICAIEDGYVSRKASFFNKRRICAIRGFVPRGQFAYCGSEYGCHEGEYVSQKVDMCRGGFVCVVKDEKVCHRRQIYAVEGECLSWKANMCHRRKICTIEGDFVPWKANVCRMKWIFYEYQ